MNLVFASGFLLPQSLLGFEYFRGIKARVAAAGHAALFPAVPPTDTCEVRAQVLADAIQQAYPAGAIHIIAHSMGGLDSRTLIGRNHHGLAAPGRIVSLTTLSTPHRGSPVADLLAGPRPDGPQRLVYDVINSAFSLAGIPASALVNLTQEAAMRVPDAARSHPHIRYRSYFGAGRAGLLPTCFALSATHHYIYSISGEANDGLVALSSAKYGEFQSPHWRCDHADMIGYNLDTADFGGFQFDHFAAIDGIIGLSVK